MALHRDLSVALGIATFNLSCRRKTPICHTSSKSHGLRDGLPRCPTPRAVHHGRHPTPCHWICTEARDRHLRLDPAKMVPDPVRKECWHLRDWRLIRVVDEGTAPSCHLLLRWARPERCRIGGLLRRSRFHHLWPALGTRRRSRRCMTASSFGAPGPTLGKVDPERSAKSGGSLGGGGRGSRIAARNGGDSFPSPSKTR